VEQTTRAHGKTARLRVMLGGAAGLAIGLALVASVSYAAGFAAGRSRGEISAHTISAAMAAGLGAASAWASLMADNDPVQALTACKKSVAAQSGPNDSIAPA
jgi:drug/metabolite transporter (DMT)-like permease